MTDTVINFKSRRPVKVEEAEAKLLAEEQQKMILKEIESQREAMVQSLELLLIRAKRNELDGLAIVAGHEATGLLINELHISAPSTQPGRLFSFAGALHAMATEATDCATMSPIMCANGNVVDPAEGAF